MTHLQQRLAERNVHMTSAQLEAIAASCTVDSAVVLAQYEESKADYLTGSNGDLVVMIVRNRQPRTIMLRRSSQPMTAEAMRVSKVIYL